MSTDTGSGKTMGEEAGNRWEEWREMVACLENLVEKEAWASMTYAHSAYACTTCDVERAQGYRSIWEHPTVHTYDPWGFGSGQSERRTQIAHAVEGGVSYENQHSVETGENHEKKMFWSFIFFWKMRDVKRMMFYCHTKFQVEKHYEMGAMKKTNSALNSDITIRHYSTLILSFA